MKSLLLGSTVLASSILSGCTSAQPKAYRVYFGTSAKKAQRGIYMATLDMKTGTLSEPVHVAKAEQPGFIAIDADGKHIYATGSGGNSSGPSAVGSVSSFNIMEDGMLSDINHQPSGGIGPCHISIDPSGSNLLVANYTGGSCSVLPIQSDGSLLPATSTQLHVGSSIHPTRQTKAFAHSINTSPDGRFAFVADLGTDKIMIYRFNAAKGILVPNDPPFASIEPGGGPRHFTFHPSGRFAYANLELNNKVTVFTYEAQQGVLAEAQTIGSLPEGFEGENTTAEILTSPNGRFLYVSNRGHDSIAIFGIDSETGTLTPLGHEPTRGMIPRNFNIDPTGTYLIAANQQTCNVVVFRIDQTTGLLDFTGGEINMPAPICIRFLALVQD